MDKLTVAKRSWNMSRIKGKNTSIELLARKYLSGRGFKYRIHYKLPGKPDIVFIGKKIAIYIDGDFWHGYNFPLLKKRLTDKFWLSKIENNIKRDKRNRAELRKLGWKVLRIWEHEIKKNPRRIFRKMENFIKKV